jgi:hypothetical protein
MKPTHNRFTPINPRCMYSTISLHRSCTATPCFRPRSRSSPGTGADQEGRGRSRHGQPEQGGRTRHRDLWPQHPAEKGRVPRHLRRRRTRQISRLPHRLLHLHLRTALNRGLQVGAAVGDEIRRRVKRNPRLSAARREGILAGNGGNGRKILPTGAG